MDASTQLVLDGLAEAIKAENEGHHFYRMAAMTTQDPQGKEVFTELAEDELVHMRFLETQASIIRSTGKADANTQLHDPDTKKGGSPIFSDAIKDRIDEAHFEMTVLSVGMQLEMSAQKFYRERAAEAVDPVVKRFYAKLEAWEAGHYDALSAQQDMLKEAYWAANGFSPM